MLLSGTAAAQINTTSSDDETTDIKPLSRMEFISQQRAMFDKADTNFDGRVNTAEANAYMDKLIEPKFKAEFQAIDTNNNGYVSLSEIETQHTEKARQRSSHTSTWRDQLLERYDLNGDGDITNSELDEVFELRATQITKSAKYTAQKDFDMKDTNGDGSISLEEFLESKQANGRIPLTPKNGLILRRDANGDYELARSENEIFISTIFSHLDLNKDDQLSASEQSQQAFKNVARLSIRVAIMKNKKGHADVVLD